jgi:hypothetical protein
VVEAAGRKGFGSVTGVGQGTQTAIDAEERSVELIDHAGALSAQRLAAWYLIFWKCAGYLILAEAHEEVSHLCWSWTWALICQAMVQSLVLLSGSPNWKCSLNGQGDLPSS